MQRLFISLFFILISFHTANAVLKIDINQGTLSPMPIAVSLFASNSMAERDIARDVLDVILNDLEGSGLFRAISRDAFLEEVAVNRSPQYNYWRKINAVSVIGGSVHIIGSKVTIQFKMWDPYAEVSIEGMTYTVPLKSWRRAAHKIADKIYQRMTGEKGYFDTRVLFISHLGRGKGVKKRLAIMDQDGANFKLLTDGKSLVLTPRFDPNSQRAIYMSYKDKVPHVYILDIERGWQRLIGHFKGMSFSPRFSPDGQSAIMSVAKDGSTNIFEIDLSDGKATKLTHDFGAINTSPSYSPDGSHIVFNSDRIGSRQLYVMDRKGSDIKRISMGTGTYATPVWSPRGDYIAFTKIEHGSFFIGVMRPDGSGERLLTTSWLDEAPSWSPNGRVIMFTRQQPNGMSNLYSIDITGYNEKRISTQTDASDPAWSPLLN